MLLPCRSLCPQYSATGEAESGCAAEHVLDGLARRADWHMLISSLL
jgi:hypothetical protein